MNWIPVTERLPDIKHVEGTVLSIKTFICTVKRTTKDGKYTGLWVTVLRYMEGHGWMHSKDLECNDRYDSEVTAWMPFPEPYYKEDT